MEIDVRDGVSVVRVGKNQLRGKSSQRLLEELLIEIAKIPVLVLDLAQASLVDSLGLGVLVKLAKVQKESDRRFAICGMTTNVRKTFTQLHLHKFIRVFQDSEHARKGLT